MVEYFSTLKGEVYQAEAQSSHTDWQSSANAHQQGRS